MNNRFQPDWAQLQQIPEFSILQDTQQKQAFHGEGNVFTHTQMAVKALLELPEWQQLDDAEQHILYYATLMHDIGKGVTTKRDENGEWRSPKHGFRGSQIARLLLWKNAFGSNTMTCQQREQIAALIEFHGMPLWAHDRENIEYEMRCVSQLVPLRWLTILSRADAIGRIANDKPQLLQRIDFFEQLAHELHCYDTPYAFANAFTRWSYASKRHTDIHYTPYDDSWGEVILLSGVPGSGKDTWIQQQKQKYTVVSMDDIRDELGVDPSDKNQGAVVQLAFQRAKQLLAQQTPFIWNATNVRAQRRKEMINLFWQYGAKTKIIYIETHYEELWHRNRTRQKPVPDHVLQRMIDTLEVPKIIEAPAVEYLFLS